MEDSILSDYLFHWLDTVYINLSWEQIFYRANLEYKAPRDYFSKKCVVHHVWSLDRADFLKKRGVPAKNIFTNGQPVYKLYEKPYKDIFASRQVLAKKFKLNPQKKWIFFPENYSWYFYSRHILEEIIRNGQDKEVAYLMRNYCSKAFKSVVRWLEKLVQESRQVEIIFRPRPATNLSKFKKIVDNLSPSLSNYIHILKDYSVREWILGSDLVVSSFSTSLIEAAIAKKPIYILEPFKIPSSLYASWYNHVERIRTKEEFLTICNAEEKNNKYIKLHNWAKSKFFSNDDPIMGLVDYLGKLRIDEYNYGKNIKKIVRVSQRKNSEFWSLTEGLTFFLGSLKRSAVKRVISKMSDENVLDRKKIERRIAIYQTLFLKSFL